MKAPEDYFDISDNISHSKVLDESPNSVWNQEGRHPKMCAEVCEMMQGLNISLISILHMATLVSLFVYRQRQYNALNAFSRGCWRVCTVIPIGATHHISPLSLAATFGPCR